ncbi:hypothetical protein JJV70_11365 [Streptomyces sp. JJ66]|uniref:hypothetical protein n=1 Tax=Streptomyces sp. JJ66 TaxID=2803843 RepID=UPI001C5827BF|nr:hypothetical protein [Streptomyces sp. JJ66]MBW1602697.1 hypothetical protein [Streptomyces sp. JJ66]
MTAVVAALTCVALLAVVTVASRTTERLTTALRVAAAVGELGEHGSVSVTGRLDASPRRIEEYLTHRAGPGAEPWRLREQARLLADLEFAAAVRASKPLNELSHAERVDTAAAISFGGADVLGVTSVNHQLYVRVGLGALAADVGYRGPVLRHTPELEELTGDLPSSLHVAQQALRGEWVRVDPEAFGEFADVLGGESGAPAERLTRSTSVLTTAEVQQHLVDAVRTTLTEHASVRDAGTRDGAEHVTVTLPARDAAHGLAAALRPVSHQLGDPDLTQLARVPDHPVHLDLAIRHGALSALTVDLARLDPRAPAGAGPLPLRLEFAPGQVVRVAAPGGAEQLHPQDLLAALTYATLREPELSSLLHTLRTLEL